MNSQISGHGIGKVFHQPPWIFHDGMYPKSSSITLPERIYQMLIRCLFLSQLRAGKDDARRLFHYWTLSRTRRQLERWYMGWWMDPSHKSECAWHYSEGYAKESTTSDGSSGRPVRASSINHGRWGRNIVNINNSSQDPQYKDCGIWIYIYFQLEKRQPYSVTTLLWSDASRNSKSLRCQGPYAIYIDVLNFIYQLLQQVFGSGQILWFRWGGDGSDIDVNARWGEQCSGEICHNHSSERKPIANITYK